MVKLEIILKVRKLSKNNYQDQSNHNHYLIYTSSYPIYIQQLTFLYYQINQIFTSNNQMEKKKPLKSQIQIININSLIQQEKQSEQQLFKNFNIQDTPKKKNQPSSTIFCFSTNKEHSYEDYIKLLVEHKNRKMMNYYKQNASQDWTVPFEIPERPSGDAAILKKHTLFNSVNNTDQIGEYRQFVKEYKNFDQNQMMKILKQEGENIDIDTLTNNGISVIYGYQELERKLQDYFRVFLLKDYYDDERLQFILYVSKFQVPIKVKVCYGKCNLNKADCYIQGGFGQLYRYKSQQQNQKHQDICLKRIKFSHEDNPQQNKHQKNKKQKIKKTKEFRSRQLRDHLREIGICKLLGILNIGPKLKKIQQFDAIVYDDCVCYAMKHYRTLSSKLNQINTTELYNQLLQKQKIKKDLSLRLALLHSMKMVHRDIKPSNVLYDEQSKKCLFCDFGLSYSIKESAFSESYVKQLGGTKGFLTKQLQQQLNKMINNKRQNKKQSFFYCLYYADYFALKKTLDLIDNIQTWGDDTKDTGYVKLNLNPVCNLEDKLQKTDKQLNFLLLAYQYNLMILKKWKQKIQLLTSKKQQQELIIYNQYFKFEKMYIFLKQCVQRSIIQNEQGLRTVASFVTGDIAIIIQNIRQFNFLEKIKKIIQKYSQQLKSSQSSVFPTQKVNEYIDTFLDITKIILQPQVLKLIQKQLRLSYDILLRSGILEQHKKIYFQIIRNIVLIDETNSKWIYNQVLLLKQRFMDTQFQEDVISYLESLACLKLDFELIQKLVDIVIQYRNKRSMLYEEKTAIIYLKAIQNSFKVHCYRPFTIQKYFTFTQTILKQIYSDFQNSRLFVKLNILKAIHCSSLENNFNEAITYTKQTMQRVKKLYSNHCSFYLDLLFNELYLARNHQKFWTKLMQEIIEKEQNLKFEYRYYFSESQKIDPKILKLLSRINVFKIIENIFITPLQMQLCLTLHHFSKYQNYYNIKFYDLRRHVWKHPGLFFIKNEDCGYDDDDCKQLKQGTCTKIHKCFKFYIKFVKSNMFQRFLFKVPPRFLSNIIQSSVTPEELQYVKKQYKDAMQHIQKKKQLKQQNVKKQQIEQVQQKKQQDAQNDKQKKEQELRQTYYNTLFDIAYKMKKKCRYGAQCPYNQFNNCDFRHDDDQDFIQDQLNQQKELQKKQKKQKCLNGVDCIYYLKGLCKFNHEYDKEQTKDTSSSNLSKQSSQSFHRVTKCRNGPNCKYYLKKQCMYFHDPEENI